MFTSRFSLARVEVQKTVKSVLEPKVKKNLVIFTGANSGETGKNEPSVQSSNW